jgi:hypothetical protein
MTIRDIWNGWLKPMFEATILEAIYCFLIIMLGAFVVFVFLSFLIDEEVRKWI